MGPLRSHSSTRTLTRVRTRTQTHTWFFQNCWRGRQPDSSMKAFRAGCSQCSSWETCRSASSVRTQWPPTALAAAHSSRGCKENQTCARSVQTQVQDMLIGSMVQLHFLEFAVSCFRVRGKCCCVLLVDGCCAAPNKSPNTKDTRQVQVKERLMYSCFVRFTKVFLRCLRKSGVKF